MNLVLATFVASGLVLGGLTVYATTQVRGWAARGITPLLPWPMTLTVGVLCGLSATGWIHSVWGTGPAIAAAAFVWLGVLAIATDSKTYKVPWDVSHPVALVGLAGFALNYTIEGLLAFAAALLGAVGVPLLVRWMTNKGLGMSDIRLLWASVATCSWWVGQTWLLYALIGAALIQVGVRVAAKPLGIGRLVPVHPDAPIPEDGVVRMRRELPFAPALLVSLCAFIAYGTHAAYGACLMWNPFGTC